MNLSICIFVLALSSLTKFSSSFQLKLKKLSIHVKKARNADDNVSLDAETRSTLVSQRVVVNQLQRSFKVVLLSLGVVVPVVSLAEESSNTSKNLDVIDLDKVATEIE